VEGTPFGRYRLMDLLGRGGMGEVWRAHDTATDRIVAIKTLPTQYSDDPMFQQRFRREAHAAARLNSPHVIPIHDYGEIDGRLYVTMRLVEGRDLEAALTDGPLRPSRAVRIIEQIAKALHAAHKVGLVHRDVKPSNVLLDEDDFAYLIDFGIARAADDTRLTGTGNAIGTFQYMAPERLGDSPDDARADIYALACVLYECLTGQPPFTGTNVVSLIAAHLHTPPPEPSKVTAGVPRPLDAVIAIGMAKDPERRYATTVQLARAAHDAVTAPPPQPVHPEFRPPDRAPHRDPESFGSRRPVSSTARVSAAETRVPTGWSGSGPEPRPALQLPAAPWGGPPPAPSPRPLIRLATVVPAGLALGLIATIVLVGFWWSRSDRQLTPAPSARPSSVVTASVPPTPTRAVPVPPPTTTVPAAASCGV
jgi:serine/threonine protein kinase